MSHASVFTAGELDTCALMFGGGARTQGVRGSCGSFGDRLWLELSAGSTEPGGVAVPGKAHTLGAAGNKRCGNVPVAGLGCLAPARGDLSWQCVHLP